VTFNGIAHTAAYVSASQLTISLTSTDLTTVGIYPVVVTNPAPGGGASSPANFTVTSSSSTNSEWAWVSGSSTGGGAGVYGSLGVPSVSNVPGERVGATSWTDGNGNLWLFGGYGVNQAGIGGYLNDLWEYSPTAKTWTWVAGANTPNQTGVYGTQGIPATSNVPGARESAVGWMDGNGNLWLFAGVTNSAGNTEHFNDLWEFSPTAKTWTWVAGANISNQAGVYGTQGIPATTNVPGARDSAVSWIDGKGNLWCFGGNGVDSAGNNGYLNDLWEFSPTAKTWTWVAGANTANQAGVYGTQGTPATTNVPGARYQAASWIDSNGNLWLFGGYALDSKGNDDFFNDLWEFNATAKTWTWVAGADTPNQTGVYGTQGTPASTNAPGARYSAVTWIDGNSNFWLFGGGAGSSQKSVFFSDLWEFNPTTKTWTWVNGPDMTNQPGAYGTQGAPAVTNIPGGRDFAVGWIDGGGNFWLFGGDGIDSTGLIWDLNDLWRFQSTIAPPTITSVSVTCSPASILTTQTSTCTPTVAGTEGYSTSVTWSVSPTTMGAVNSAGVFTPSAAGTATITATSAQDTNKFGSTTVTVSTPSTISIVSVSCASATVTTGQTSQCSATVSGTGNYSSGVTWAVNGVSGGNATYGAISTGGLYQAPTTAPAAYIVTVSATSSMDSTKSGSFLVLIAGTIASASMPIVASVGGTISLPGGDSVTIPAGTLTANTTVTLQLSSVATQPTNTLFGGIGPSLLMSFSPAVGGVGAAVSRHAFRPSAAASASTSSSTSNITFILQGGQGPSTTQLQNAFGVLNVNDGTNNFFSLPSSYDATANATTLTVDPSMIEPSSTLEIGIAVAVANGQNQGGNPSLEQWDDSIPAFVNTPANYCPTGSRVLVLIHGIFSDVQDSFGMTGGAAGCALKNGTSSCPVARGPYDTVLGINYDWSQPIASSSLDVANILNSFFTGSCSFSGTFDIEAHSEGTLVTLTSANSLSSSAQAKLAHIALVAGPIDGTPLASDADAFITVFMNEALEAASSVIDPEITQNQKEQLQTIIPELAPGSSAVTAAQSAAANNLSQTEIVAVGGDKSFLPWWGSWIETLPFFDGAPNDGVVPVASALPTDSSLPNLVRLVGNDPTAGDYPYPDNHVSLVNNQNVMPDILNSLNGAGETSQVTLGVSPQAPVALVDQSITFTANTTNILNPQVQWEFNGGTTSGTLSSPVGTSVNYLAPGIAGGPFPISATLPAIIVPAGSTIPLTSSATISVVNPVPTVSTLSPSSLAPGATPQALTINGTGFLASSTVTYNGVAHTPAYVSASELTITLTTADLATAGSYPVVVTNPPPGGGPSAALAFIVSSVNPLPAITSLSPASLAVGATPQTLTIDGTGFLTISTVTFNGITHSPTYVNASQLTISLTSADLGTAGEYPVVVTNPAPGGGTSPSSYFTVINSETANEWTWISGSSTVGALGVYGTLGVPSASNVPGSRNGASSWTDSKGNFWLFGGSGSLGSLNDLWMFDHITENWTWVSGSSTADAVAVYGSQGVPATTNVPGARFYAVSWIDKNDKLWLFGGDGVGSNNVSGFLDDLWEFDPVAKTWTWVSGNSASDTPGVYGTLGEPSTGNVPGARYFSVSWIDSGGNLWLFGGEGWDSTGFYGQLNDLWEFNPTTLTWTWVGGASSVNVDGVYGTEGVPSISNWPGSRSEAVSWVDSSGNLWLFGGNGWNSSGGGGTLLDDLWKFNPAATTWTWVSGSSTTYTANSTFSAIGVYGTEGVAAAGNTPGGRTNPARWIDANENLWLFGGNGYASTATTGELNDLWEFNPSSGEWTWANGGNTTNGIGIYGTSGVSASTNVPGSRDYPVSWIDNNGYLWLLGGEGYDSKGTFNLLNDLWRYQPLSLTAPSIIGVNPTTFTAPLYGQTITIDGSNFQSGDTLSFVPPVGSAISSTPSNLTLHSGSQISYQFNDTIFVGGALGTWTVTVTNPDGQSSNTWNFTTVCQLCETNP